MLATAPFIYSEAAQGVCFLGGILGWKLYIGLASLTSRGRAMLRVVTLRFSLFFISRSGDLGGGAEQGLPDSAPDLGRYEMVWGRSDRSDFELKISWLWRPQGLFRGSANDVWLPYINFLLTERVSDQATIRRRGLKALARGSARAVAPLVQDI